MIYLVIGLGFGSIDIGLTQLEAVKDAKLLERISEVVVVISLFTAGLKLRAEQLGASWRPAYRLASVSMILTVILIAVFANQLLGFSVGAAILLGAILAPTDPVLASEVQVRDPDDRDPLRFTLTAEAGFNDGTAFPFVMLGLGLMGLHELGDWGLRWLGIDILWQIVAGLGVGAALGTGTARFIIWLRQKHQDSEILDDFLTIGLIGLSYGVALAINSYGFLSVFAAGLALRRIERLQNKNIAATEADSPSSEVTHDILNFNQQLERLGEVATVILVGALLARIFQWSYDLLLIPALLFIIRPVAVTLGLLGSQLKFRQRAMISWFGIRGIGSVFYLTYAIAHGVPTPMAERLVALVLTTIAVSIVIHGISVNPLMKIGGGPKNS